MVTTLSSIHTQNPPGLSTPTMQHDAEQHAKDVAALISSTRPKPPSEAETLAMQHDAKGWIKLPGFGMPLEQETPLPIAQDWYASPITVKERSMVALMLALKDKPNWHQKVFNEEIVSRWRAEAMAFSPDHGKARTSADRQGDVWNDGEGNGQNLDMDGEERQKKIDEKAFDYCIAELRDDARFYEERGFTKAIDANACTYMSDSAVSPETKELLKEGVKPLENVRGELKDWHPGSDGKVLDLVHPSLFPLFYGKSRILPREQVPLEKCAWSTGLGEVIPEQCTCEESYSDNYQWLPCEVALDAEKNASITSYINNLHPHSNDGLYKAIANVISAAVPLWTETILSTRYLTGRRLAMSTYDGWIELPRPEATIDENGDEIEDDEDYWDNWDNYHEIEIPQPKSYTSLKRVNKAVFEIGERSYSSTNQWDTPLRDPNIVPTADQIQTGDEAMTAERSAIEKIFSEQGLQVIVKLANIHLTPSKPTYDGGSWHIEGQLNEHICASALYYYDSSNITDSYLAFRETVDKDELQAEQHRYQALMEIYGINDSWGDALQVLGAVHTREDRLLVFPNVLQHRVSPFSLVDKTRPGHRKLLALFLVDPHIRIPSTANVPPQQIDWWKKAMEQKGSLTQRLPVELADKIVEGVEDGFPWTMEEAKKIREDLIEERRQFVDAFEEGFRENGYCFCEH